MNKDINISKVIQVGLEVLSSEDVKVSSKDIEALAGFKDILRAILNGQLVIASPDRIIPETEQTQEEK